MHKLLCISKDVDTIEESNTASRKIDTSKQIFSIPKFVTYLLHRKVTPCFEGKV